MSAPPPEFDDEDDRDPRIGLLVIVIYAVVLITCIIAITGAFK